MKSKINKFNVAVIITFAYLLTCTSVFAQSPQKISYQAVVRNSSNQIIINQPVGMKISVLQGSEVGTVIYKEIYNPNPQTNANGLVSFEIGSGIPLTGTFSNIDWANGTYFIKIETDPTGGTNYTISGISQLLSVPYALHAKTAESLTGTITESDPVFLDSQAANITNSDIIKLSNLSGTNSGDQDLSSLATTSAVTTALNLKVDKEAGKGLSTNDYTTTEQTKLAAISGTNTGDQDLSDLATTSAVATALNLKVDKEAGKGLSTNDYTTTEQTKLAGIAANAEVNVNADWNAVTGDAQILNKPTIPAAADGSETKVTAGTNVTVTGSGTTASPYVVNATGATTLTVGQSYQGGIIFWLDATGQHGLIAATTNQSTGTQWYNGTYRYTGTTGDGLYAGAMNTAMTVATQMADNQTGNFAAKVCADYLVTVGGVTYGDWYLPSKYELNLLYLQKTAVGGFDDAYYWSSTEGYTNDAWVQYFYSGFQYSANKGSTLYVRAVRAF